MTAGATISVLRVAQRDIWRSTSARRERPREGANLRRSG